MATALLLDRCQFAIVDDDDALSASQLAWRFDHGYASTFIEGRKVYLHRWLMDLTPGDGTEVDHKNGDTLDCRRVNLRVGTRHLNKQNLRPYKGRFRGVSWNPTRGKWEASVRVNGKRVFFARFYSEQDAGEAATAARAALMPWTQENTELPDPVFEEYTRLAG
jgi:hypothetical protein